MSRVFASPRRARLLVGVFAASLSLVVATAVASASGERDAFLPAFTAVARAEVVPPDDLGDDARLDDFAAACFEGDLLSCDLLFLLSPVESAYEQYGDTCAGRQDAGGEEYCILGRSDGGVPLEPIEPTASTEPADSSVPAPPDSTDPSEPGTLPAPTMEPTGLGGDPALDELANQCYDGDMAACDGLYGSSEVDSDYQVFGDTCAGRQPENTGRLCVLTFETPVVSTPAVVPDVTTTTADEPAEPTEPTIATEPGNVPPATIEPTGLGSDGALDELARSCYDGDMAACDQLWRDAEQGSDYRNYGDTCAGRQPAQTGVWCTSAFPTDSEPTAPATTPDTTLPVTTTITPVATAVPPSTTTPEETVPGSVPAVIPPPTVEPAGLGIDPVLDALAEDCYDGDLAACDDLWRQSDLGTDYHEYGDTCAGRQPTDTGRWCVDAFAADVTTPPTVAPTTTLFVPPPPTTTPATTTTTPGSGIPAATQQPIGLGDDPVLDALAQRCYDGDMVACDALFDASPLKTPYHTYGDTCAGRQPAGTFKYCRAAFPDAVTGR